MKLDRVCAGSLKHVAVGPLDEYPERAIQFGEGNFLRAFVDWHLHELNKRGVFRGRVVVVQPLPKGRVDALNEQDGLYTLVLRGVQDGKIIDRREVITAVSRGINPYTHWDEFLQCARNPDLRFCFSNTTEAGIAYAETEFPKGACPTSFPAKVAAFLYERFTFFKGDPTRGLLLLPCELIEANGQALREIVLRHAVEWNLGADFTRWIDQCNHFYDTLVDRIVPGFPANEAGALFRELGYQDSNMVFAEPFHLWAIQGRGSAKEELPFTAAGLNVHWTSDLPSYRELKVRILNGGHTLMAIPAFMAGLTTVRQSVDDPDFGKFLRFGLRHEILPALYQEEDRKKQFARSVIERFSNPFIEHQLSSIMLNSVSKFAVRVLPTLMEYREVNGRLPRRIVFSLAALLEWYANPEAPLQEDEATLAAFRNPPADTTEYVNAILGKTLLWGADLLDVPDLVETVDAWCRIIRLHGTRKALAVLHLTEEERQ